MPVAGMNVTRASELGVGEHTGPSPGPIYLPKKVGGIGAQVLSNVSTEPRVLIGTGPRWAKADAAQPGPGPGAYSLPPAPRGPVFTIRSRTVFGSENFNTASGNPGPGTHTRLETVQTRRKNAPAFSMRPRRAPGAMPEPTPAPGHTQSVRAAIEPVADSQKPNIPGMLFGSGARAPSAKAVTGDVGPGEYDVSDMRMIAGKPNAPKFSIKWRHPPPKPAAADAEFKNLPRGLGKQVVSTSKTAPAFSLGARTKFAGYKK
jgi:hypothetical protein